LTGCAGLVDQASIDWQNTDDYTVAKGTRSYGGYAVIDFDGEAASPIVGEQLDPVLRCMGREHARYERVQRGAVSLRQATNKRGYVRLESDRRFGDERSTGVGEADQHGASVGGGRRAGHEAAALGAFDEPARARLVETQQPAQLVDRRVAIAKDSEQTRLDDREVVLGCSVLEHAIDDE